MRSSPKRRVSVSAETYARLKAWCDERGMAVSDVVECALLKGMDDHDAAVTVFRDALGASLASRARTGQKGDN